jgi:hypothetical protein
MKKIVVVLVMAVLSAAFVSPAFASEPEYAPAADLNELVNMIEDNPVLITDEDTGETYEQDVVVDDVSLSGDGKNATVVTHSDIIFSASRNKPVGKRVKFFPKYKTPFCEESYADSITWDRNDRSCELKITTTLDYSVTYERINKNHIIEYYKLTGVSSAMRKYDSKVTVRNAKLHVQQWECAGLYHRETKTIDYPSINQIKKTSTRFKHYIDTEVTGSMVGAYASGKLTRGSQSWSYQVNFFLVNNW